MEDNRNYEVEVLSAPKKGILPLSWRTFRGRVGKHETTGDGYLTKEQAEAAVSSTVETHRRGVGNSVANKGRVFFGRAKKQ
jgi:hypothetical protein